MNRNKLIGKGLAYTVKVVACLKLTQVISPQGVILVKCGSKIINGIFKVLSISTVDKSAPLADLGIRNL